MNTKMGIPVKFFFFFFMRALSYLFVPSSIAVKTTDASYEKVSNNLQ